MMAVADTVFTFAGHLLWLAMSFAAVALVVLIIAWPLLGIYVEVIEPYRREREGEKPNADRGTP